MKKNSRIKFFGSVLSNPVNKGNQGTIHVLHLGSKKYIVKVFNFDKPKANVLTGILKMYKSFGIKTVSELQDYIVIKKIKEFRNEINIHLIAQDLKISPKILSYDLELGNIVMEYVDGITLRTFLKKDKMSKELENKINKCFDKLYNIGISHNDITVDNIMLDKNMKIYIIDFGISSMQDEPIPLNKRSYVNTTV